MGIQDSVNTIIGSVTNVGVGKTLHKFKTSQQASTEAQWRMEDQLNSIKNTKVALQKKLDNILAQNKVDIADTFKHPYGQATIHPGLGKEMAGKKVTLREDDHLDEPGVAEGNITILKRGGYR